jgi:hypothetical protein
MSGLFSEIDTADLEQFLKDLQVAYLTGASLVSFQGMQTQYNSSDIMRRKIQEVQAELDSRDPSSTEKTRTKRVYVQTNNRGFGNE